MGEEAGKPMYHTVRKMISEIDIVEVSWKKKPHKGFPSYHNGKRHHRAIRQGQASSRDDANVTVTPNGGRYGDIADWCMLLQDHPAHHYHLLWSRIMQGGISDEFTVDRNGWYDKFQGDKVRLTMTIARVGPPLVWQTCALVLYELYKKFLIDDCVWLFTDWNGASGIYDSGWLRKGRDQIYMCHNPHLAKILPKYANHPQNDKSNPNRPKGHKEEIRKVQQKYSIGVGWNLLQILQEIQDVCMVHLSSGAMVTPNAELSTKYVTDCRFANGDKWYDFWDTSNMV